MTVKVTVYLLQQAFNGQISTTKMLEKGKKLDDWLGETPVKDNSNMEYQPRLLYPKGRYDAQKDVYYPGCFVVGTDIPAGRYIFTAIDNSRGHIRPTGISGVL